MRLPCPPLIAAATLLVGCVSAPAIEAPADGTVLLQYLPGEDGAVRLSAPYGGTLAQRGQCLGLLNGDHFMITIWPASARLSFDRRGLLLRDLASGVAVRLGDWVEITGGPLPPGTQHQLGSPPLVQGMPIECARYTDVSRHDWIGIANRGFRKGPRERH